MKKHKARLTKKTKAIRIMALISAFVLGFISYKTFTTPIVSPKPEVQSILNSQVPSPKGGDSPVASGVGEGEAFVYMRIPRFGKDWLWVSVEGTALDDIAKGPGHYSGTALPGEVGNSAFAGHRTTHGQPFFDFEKLEVGDKVFLSQTGAEWEYEIVTKPKVIEANNWKVVQPTKNGRWLTLTTCWPKYGSTKRMFVRATMIGTNSLLG